MWHIQQIVSEHPCHRSCVVARPVHLANSDDAIYWAKLFTASKHQPDFERFSRQVELDTVAFSPGLVPIVEANLSGSMPIIVYPFIRAQSLVDWLNSQSQAPSNLRMIQIVRQLLETLNAIHHAGMAHSQINMDHLLITNFDDSLRLVGLSCVEPIGKYIQLPRTASRFDAPEVRKGFFEVSSASDVYSVGKVMVELFGTKAASWPIVKAMTATKVIDRPTSSELLVLLKDLEFRLKRDSFSAYSSMSRAA